MSLKIDMMVEHLRTNKDWKLIPKGFIRLYLRKKFKCSHYMTKKAVEKLRQRKQRSFTSSITKPNTKIEMKDETLQVQ